MKVEAEKLRATRAEFITKYHNFHSMDFRGRGL